MRLSLALLIVSTSLAAACVPSDAPTAVESPGPHFVRQSSGQPTSRVVATVYADDALLIDGVEALFHASRNNTWFHFASQHPGRVNISGPGRVQFADGSVRAKGLVILELASGGALYIDLGQLEGARRSPFEIGPGGGCLVGLTGLLVSPQNPEGVLIALRVEFPWPQ